MVATGCAAHNRFASQRAIHHRSRNQLAHGRAVTQRAIGIEAPRQQAPTRPFQNQVVARAAEIIGHKRVLDIVVGQIEQLPLGEVGERPLNQPGPGIFEHHQLSARRWRKSEADLHRQSAH